MSEINYHAFRIMQNATARQRGEFFDPFPSAEITRALRRMGLKRTPGTNGEGTPVVIEIEGRQYNVLAASRGTAR